MPTLKQQAYRHIRDKLLSGEPEPGSRMSEAALAKEMGISRGPVREAISQLASEGLVEQVPRFGVFVTMPSARELEELYDLREMLECYAVGRACERIDADSLQELHSLRGEMYKMAHEHRDSGDEYLDDRLAGQWLMADTAFHMILLKAADRPLTMKTVSDLRMMTQIFGHRREQLDLRNVAITLRDHVMILRALSAGDAAAAQEHMAHHVRQGKAHALESYEERERRRADGQLPPPDLPEELRRIIRRMEGGSRG